MATCFDTNLLGWGHTLAGQICGPDEYIVLQVVLAAVAIVVLFVFGSNIWAWAQMKRRQGGLINFLLWIVAAVLALLGVILGWAIGFIGSLIIIGTIIAFFRK